MPDYETCEDELDLSHLEVVEPKDIDDVKKIVQERQCCLFQWGNDQMLVDATTANMLCIVYDALKTENKAKVNRMIAASKTQFCKVVNIGWKACK